MPRNFQQTLREKYFDPDYMEIKYITEDTTLHALRIHGYLPTYLFNRLYRFDTIGEIIDTPISDLMKIPHFGSGSFKKLIVFFEENHDKFKLKGLKPVIKKKQSCEEKMKVVESKLKKMDAYRSENIKLKKANELAKIEYDNYYKDSLNSLHEKIKQKDIQIGTLRLSNNEAYKALQALKIKIDGQ
jgi:hypothetical protein|nr:hypothetical protein [uncultured Mediterranean phage uvMED]